MNTKRITISISQELAEALQRLSGPMAANATSIIEEGLLARAFNVRQRARKGLQDSVVDFACMVRDHMLPGDTVTVRGREIAMKRIYTRVDSCSYLTLDGAMIVSRGGYIHGDFDYPYEPLPHADFRWLRDHAAEIWAAVVALNRREAEKDSAWVEIHSGAAQPES